MGSEAPRVKVKRGATGISKDKDPVDVSVDFTDRRATYTTYSVYEHGKRWLLAGVVPGPPNDGGDS